MNNYEDYSYFYRGLNKLILYKSNLTILFSLFKIVIIKLDFLILLIDEIIKA
ncbi:hypothetical protein C8034_v003646 [Colletotrichum sidae]|uniref:Uncharacterized protein n=1 Tax=Colletotrichum sidae TaxID=1347389 RepID=A0A4R8S8T4_9PEZI|nr:hypothetical protein C8034_v003646 [Colletotrichum sidae]